MNTKKKFYENSEIFNYEIPEKNINTERNITNNLKNQKSKQLEPKRLKNYGNFTAGRGLGNLNENNEIRFGSDSRLDNEKFKLKKESMVNDRFDYLFDTKKQSTEHLILPFNRGGEITRKVNTDGEKIFRYQEDELNKDRPLPFNDLLNNDLLKNNLKVKKPKKKIIYKKKFTFKY